MNAKFIGPTGTGKTLYVSRYIKSLPLDHFLCMFLCFSAQTN